MLVRAWRETTDVAASLAAGDGPPPTVAAVLTGPYTLASAASNAAEATALALRLHDELLALAEAGCTLAVIDEPAAIGIGTGQEARRRFREAQAVLLGDDPPLHAMLAITGGSAWDAGPETILDGPYASYLSTSSRVRQLVPGPGEPGNRGIVFAALRAPSSSDQAPLLVSAARIHRLRERPGPGRVGLANTSSLARLDVAAARASLEALARAARLAALDPGDAVAAGLDRRTFAQALERGAGPRPTLR